MTKHEHNHEHEHKHDHCQCEHCECEQEETGCECEQEETGCECEDCHCNEHNHEHNHEHCHCEDCHCEDGCECDDCECDDCECNDCECDDCECDDCECDDDQKNDYLEHLQRLQAEFDNYRKRNEFIVLKAKEEGVTLAVEKLLPVLDSFKAAEKTTTPNELKGLLLVKEQLLDGLKQLGVTQIDALGKPFNPDFHNAVIMGEEQGKESHIVLEVFQDGYMLKDKIIRHSIVKINK